MYQGGVNKQRVPAGRYVTIGLASKHLGVSVDTIRRWERIGKLEGHRLDGKNRYFRLTDLDRFKQRKPLSTAEVAGKLGVSESTVRRLEDKGELVPDRNESGKRLYTLPSVSDYMTRQEANQGVAKSAVQEPSPQVETPERSVVNLTLPEPQQPQASSLFLPENPVENRGDDSNFIGRHPLQMTFVSLMLLALIGSWWGLALNKPSNDLGSLASANSGLPKTGALKSPALVFPNTLYIALPSSGLTFDLSSPNYQGRVVASNTSNFVTSPITGNEIGSGAVGSQQIANGGVNFVDLSASLQALIGSVAPVQQAAHVTNVTNVTNVTQGTTALAGLGLSGSLSNNTLTLGVRTGDTTNVVNNSLEVALTNGVTTSTTSSGSGLEATAQGLQLLGGCGSGQVLEWTGTAWVCASIGSGSSNLAVKVGGTTITPNATGIDFGGSDFNVVDNAGQSEVTIDYANSGIAVTTANEAVTGNWSFKDSGFTITTGASNKQAKFDNTAISPGTTRTFSFPDTNGTLITTGNLNNITAVGTVGSGSWQGSTVGVQFGGTGATSFANGGVLYGNGTGALQATAAGSGGQLLLANGGGTPAFASLSGDATLSALGALTLANSGVTANTYGDGTHVPVFTVDSKGRITGVTNTLITGAAPTGAAGGDLGGTYPNPTIAKLQGNTLTIGTLSGGQILQYNGTALVNQTLSGDITLSNTGVSTIGAGKVTNGDLANSSLTVTAGNGLTGGGSVALGSSTSLAVAYGAAANTAVQGNVTLTCASGTGNLSGGGNTVTLGSGGSCNNISISNSPTFSGTLAVQGASVTVGAAAQQGSLVLNDGNGASNHTATLLSVATLGQNTTYTLPDPGQATAIICLSTNNCSATGAAGGDLTGSYPNPTIAAGVVTGAKIANNTITNANILSGNFGNITGVGTLGSLAVGPGFSVNGSGAVTAATGITSSGTVTFSGLSTAGVVTNTATGQLGTVATLPVANGGTNIASYTTGDILFASAAGTLSKLADVAAGSCLISGGVSVAPTYGSCSAGGGITGTGSANFVARFNTGSTLSTGQLYDNGTDVSVGGTSPLALFNVGASNQFQVSGAGAVTAVGVDAGTGLIQGTGGLTVGGTATLSGLGAGVIHANSSGVLSSSAVVLGTETTGGYVANLGALTGLTTSGNSGAGSTPSLSVTYGSGVSTAVQGNVTLTCASGTGNLSGGGNTITLGSGGSCNNISITNSPTFSGTLAVQGATVTVGAAAQQGSLILNDGNGASNKTATLQSLGTLGQNTTYTLPDPGAATATICLSTGNCTAVGAAGGDLNGSYPNPTIAKLQGTTLTLSSVTSGQILQYNGTALVNQTLSGDITLSNTGVSTIGAGKVTNGDLANSSLTVTAGNGLTGGGSVSLGSSTSLAVAYGSSANTAAQGNTALTFNGSGNLTGSISGTAGGGFTTTTLAIVNSPTFSGTLAVQGATTTIGTSSQQGSLVLNDGNGASNHTATLQGLATLGQNTTYTLPDPGQATATICLTTGNCTAVGTAGGDLTGSYPNPTIATGAVTGTKIANNTITNANLSSGSFGNITGVGTLGSLAVGPGFTINGSGAITAATGLTTSGSVTLSGLGAGIVHASSGGVLTSSAVALGTDTTGSYVANLGTLTGLTTSGNSGAGSAPTLAVTYGSAASTAVQGNVTLTCPTGSGNLSGGGTVITLGTGGACAGLTMTSSPSFSGLLTDSTSGANAVAITGTPLAGASGATSSLVQFGPNAISGGNNTATTGGTFLGINEPNTGTGSTADFLNFENNNNPELKVTSGGAVTATSFTGNGSGLTNLSGGNLTAGSVTNGDLANSSVTVTAGNGLSGGGSVSLGSSTSLAVAYGSAANTAVQGNVTLTCPTGSGNLSGGGTAITLGTGGTCGAITMTNSPTFSGTLAVQGAGGATLGSTTNAGVLSFLDGTSDGFTVGFKPATQTIGSSTITIPNLAGTNDQICLKNLANCSSGGSFISNQTTQQTNANIDILSTAGHVAAIIQGASGQDIADFLANGGGTVASISASGKLTSVGLDAGSGLIQGTGGLTSGGTTTLSALGAGIVHASSGGVLTSSAVALGTDTTGSYVANLGTLTGLTTSGNSGAGSAPTLAVTYGSAASTAVQGNVTLTCPTGSGNLSGGGTVITLGTGGSCGGISMTNSPSFSGVVTASNSGANALSVSGTPLAGASGATSSLVQFGPNPISGGNNTATTGGTYLGLNAPASGAGSTADFINFESNSTPEFKVTSAGAVSATSFTGDGSALTNLSGAHLTAGSVTNADLANSSLTVTAGNGLSGGGSVSLGGSTSLAVAYGSAANTAVQGNVTLTCPGASGNLSGGGNTITLGTGGSCSAISMTNSPSFSGAVTASNSGANALAVTGTPLAGAAGATSSLVQFGPNAISGGNNTATTGGTYLGLNAPASGAGSTADFINFETNSTPEFKVTSGGAVTATSFTGDGSALTNLSGAHLTAGSVTNADLANSSLTVTAGNGLSGGGSVSLGGSTSLAVAYGSAANTAVQGNVTLTCPTGSGNLSGGGTVITLGTGGACAGLTMTSSPSFSGLLTDSTSGANAVAITGTPLAGASGATSSLVQFGPNAISGGNNTATTGGTFLGINEPNTGTGSTADFLNFENNNNPELKVTSGGAVTATSFTGNGSGLTNLSGGNLTAGSVTNGDLANSSVTVTAGNGLSGGGSVSLGGSTSLAVAYGSAANTAVQGNVTLTCPTGSGNLSGGGTAITLGTGGTCGAITMTNTPTFSGQVTLSNSANNALAVTGTPLPGASGATSSLVQFGPNAIAGGNTTATTGGTYLGLNAPASGAGSTADFINFEHGGTPEFQVSGSGAVTATSFTGDGSALTNLSGAHLTAGSVTNGDLANSSVTVTAGNGLSGGGSVALGSSTSLAVAYGSSANTAVQGNVTLTCPSASGNLSGGGNTITLGTGGSCSAISMTNAPSFSGLVTASNSGANALLVNGTPLAGASGATSSLVQFGPNAISGGNNTATTGGTYLGLNAPASGAGSTADFINFESNNTPEFKVTSGGAVTATSFTGNGSALTNLNGGNLTAGSVTNGDLANSSLTVTAGNGLTGGGSVALGSSTSLAVAYGSAANTAVEGNVTLTCPTGSGNLGGGGTVITLGTGGACAGLTMTSSPSFSGLLTDSTSAANAVAITGTPPISATASLVQFGNAISGGNNTPTTGGTYLGIGEAASGAGSTADFIDFLNGVTHELRVTSGGAVTATSFSGDGSGLTNLSGAHLTAGSVTNADLANSSLTVSPGTGLTGGGSVSLGGSSAGLNVAYGSAASTAVQGNTTLVCPAGTGNLAGGGGTITLGSGGTCGAITTNNNVSFVTETLTNSGTSTPALELSGVPDALATTSLIQLGATGISGGNANTNGGTLLGVNLSAAGAGSAADFINLQKANAVEFKVDNGGNGTFGGGVTATSFTGNGSGLTSLSGANITAGSIANAALANSSLTVTAGTGLTGGGSVSLGGSSAGLNVAYGSAAGTAAQGNTALTFNGTGNLTGSLSGTAGGGFTTTTLALSNSPTFSGTVQGATVVATGALQGNSVSVNSGALAISSAGAITAATGITSTGATSLTGTTTINTGTANALAVTSGANVPTADQFTVDNTGSTGVTAAGINAVNVHYKGGAAAVEGAGMRVDYTPGTTSGGTWSGMRIVENTSAGSGVTSYGLKLEGGGGGTGTSTAVEVATGWDIGIDVQSGGIQMAAQSDPAAPAAGNLRIYAKDIAGRILPKWIGPAGVDTPFQASLGFNRVALSAPIGTANCSTGSAGFGSSQTGAGTCAVPALASTNLLASVRRETYSTGGTAGTVTYQRQSQLQVWRGNAAGRGGFFYTIRFGTSALAAGNRMLIGMSDTVANPTNIDPTTSTTYGKLGLAINASTGNWNFINNASGTAPTVTALGASFPVDTTDLYELVLYSAPDGTSIGWRVTDISTGAQTSGSVSTNIPSSTTFLAPVFWADNNATAAASIIDFSGWYLESDN